MSAPAFIACVFGSPLCGAEVLAGRLAEGHSKCGNECADALVADVECHRRNRFAAGQQPERVTEPELLTPFAEAQTRFQLEYTLDGALAGAGNLPVPRGNTLADRRSLRGFPCRTGRGLPKGQQARWPGAPLGPPKKKRVYRRGSRLLSFAPGAGGPGNHGAGPLHRGQ